MIISLSYIYILLFILLYSYEFFYSSTLKDSNPQSPNPKLGAFTNLAKDAYSTSIQKPFPYNNKNNSNVTHWPHSTFRNYIFILLLMYVSSGLVEIKKYFNYVPLEKTPL